MVNYRTNDMPINNLHRSAQMECMIYPDPTARDTPIALNMGLFVVDIVLAE